MLSSCNCEFLFQYEEQYGFFPEDPYLDKATFHLIMFMGVSLALVFMPMMWMYGPDFRYTLVLALVTY